MTNSTAVFEIVVLGVASVAMTSGAVLAIRYGAPVAIWVIGLASSAFFAGTAVVAFRHDRRIALRGFDVLPANKPDEWGESRIRDGVCDIE